MPHVLATPEDENSITSVGHLVAPTRDDGIAKVSMDGNILWEKSIKGILERNGYRLNASEEEATAAIMALASHTITEEDFAHWLQDNCE